MERRFVSRGFVVGLMLAVFAVCFVLAIPDREGKRALSGLFVWGVVQGLVSQLRFGTGALVLDELGLRIERLPGVRVLSRFLPWHVMRRAWLEIDRDDSWILHVERDDGSVEQVSLHGIVPRDELFALIAQHVELDVSAQDGWVPYDQRPFNMRILKLVLLFIATGALTFIAEAALVRGWHPTSTPLWLVVFTMPLASVAITWWFRRDGKPDAMQDGIVGGVLVCLVLVWTAVVLNRALTEFVPLRSEQATLRLVEMDYGMRKPVVELAEGVRISFPQRLADDFFALQDGAIHRIRVQRGLFGDVAIWPEASAGQ